MQASVAAEARPAAEPFDWPDLKQVFRNAQKAFNLIQKYRTPPEPKTYAVWYAYVSATDKRLVDRVDSAISQNGTLTPFDIGAIFQEFLTEQPGASARHTIGLAIEKQIDGAMKIIQQGVQNSDEFGASLNRANEALPDANSADTLATLVSDLITDNKRMAKTTRALKQGLIESQKQIATLNKELEEVQSQSLRDPLTSVANRRAFDERLEREVRAAEETGETLCLAMADIDGVDAGRAAFEQHLRETAGRRADIEAGAPGRVVGEAVERRLDPVEGAAVGGDIRRVVGDELVEKPVELLVGRRLARADKGGIEHGAGAAADHLRRRAVGDRRHVMPLEDDVQRAHQVRRGVDERAVEVEGDGRCGHRRTIMAAKIGIKMKTPASM